MFIFIFYFFYYEISSNDSLIHVILVYLCMYIGVYLTDFGIMVYIQLIMICVGTLYTEDTRHCRVEDIDGQIS